MKCLYETFSKSGGALDDRTQDQNMSPGGATGLENSGENKIWPRNWFSGTYLIAQRPEIECT